MAKNELSRHSNILAFDTSLEACSVAVHAGRQQGDRLLTTRFEPMRTGQAERLLPMIAETLAVADLHLSLIDAIAVTVGPGSFTGTRIGVAAARGLALSRSIPLLGFSTLAVMARGAAVEDDTRNMCVAVDVRRGEFYCQVFDHKGYLPITQPEILSREKTRALQRAHAARAVGSDITPLQTNDIETSYPPYIKHKALDAKFALELALQAVQYSYEVSCFYLRPPDAKATLAFTVQRS